MEVVMFSEGRTKDEIAHNTLIKDCMRRPGTTTGSGQGLHGEEVTPLIPGPLHIPPPPPLNMETLGDLPLIILHIHIHVMYPLIYIP